MWSPITIEELSIEINKALPKLNAETLLFWDNIRIVPQKWQEKEYGNEGGGFWVVAIFGKSVIWYNDIEEGFNVSVYSNYGEIEEFGAEQDELDWCLNKIINKK